MQSSLTMARNVALKSVAGSPLLNLCRGFKSISMGCNSLEESKKGVACRRPDLRTRPLPCYRYGFCREPDHAMRLSCPPKIKKRGRGPCCHEVVDERKGGCKVRGH